MRKTVRVLSICLLIALVLSLGMPAAFAEGGVDCAGNHVWGNWVTTEQAACTYQGKMERECIVCGQIDTGYPGVLDHNLKDGWVWGDTNHWRECTNCTTRVYETGHTMVMMYNDSEHWLGCTVCPYTKDKAAHTFTADLVNTGDTNHFNLCTVCGMRINEAAHTWVVDSVINDPTCVFQGHVDRHCSVCNRVELNHETGIWAPHDYQETSRKNATCTEDGEIISTCTVCGDIKTEIIPKGHDFTGEWVLSADNEQHARKCANPDCEEIGPYENHKYTDATPSGDGKTHWKECTECSYKQTYNHTPGDVPAKNATCTEPGHTAGKECIFCHEVLEGMVTIPAGHKWDAGTVTIKPTCTDKGEKTYKCGVCGDTKTEPIKALGHDLSDWHDNGDGTHSRECLRDGCKTTETKVHHMGYWLKHPDKPGYFWRWCDAPGCGYHEIWEGTGSPKTGDTSNIPLYAGLCLVAVGGVAGVLVYLKKKKKAE